MHFQLHKRIGWDIDLVVVLLNGPATYTKSELKMDWIMNYVNFQSRLRRNFSGSVNFKAVFSSDSVNVARPLSKTTTKSMSQPILLKLLYPLPASVIVFSLLSSGLVPEDLSVYFVCCVWLLPQPMKWSQIVSVAFTTVKTAAGLFPFKERYVIVWAKT